MPMQMRKTEIQNSISIGHSSLQDRETATRNSVRRAADPVPVRVPVYREGGCSRLESQFPNGTLQAACHPYAGRLRAPNAPQFPTANKKIFPRARSVALASPQRRKTLDTLELSSSDGTSPYGTVRSHGRRNVRRHGKNCSTAVEEKPSQ